MILEKMGKYKEALINLRACMDILLEKFDSEHPDCMKCLNSIRRVEECIGECKSDSESDSRPE